MPSSEDLRGHFVPYRVDLALSLIISIDVALRIGIRDCRRTTVMMSGKRKLQVLAIVH
jgi:hypothetical protein